MPITLWPATLLFVIVLSACTTTPVDPTADWSARKLYNDASSALANSKFDQAVEYFELLESCYPFGRYTLQSQLDIAYAHYKRREYDSTIDAANRFTRLHPGNAHIDYAYYLKGLANFSRGSGLFTSFTGRDLSNIDQQALNNAFADFDTLIRRFPNSIYAPDAQQRLLFLRNEMARHELQVAQFYYGRGAMLATINRVKYIVEHFDGAPAVKEGLSLMVNAYRNMGLEGLADDTLRVLAKTDSVQAAPLSKNPG